MSTALAPAAGRPTTPADPSTSTVPPTLHRSMLEVTQLRVLRSEWTKFRSLRSTVWTLVVAVVLMVGIGALVSAVTASHYATASAGDRATFSAVGSSLSGTLFAQLAVGVLGVLLISGEYGTGMIRASLTVVPRRLPVLWAKLAVFAGAVSVVALVAAFASFGIGQALLGRYGIGVGISAPGALREVVGAALYLTVAGMIGVALGALLRTTAAGIATFAGVFFVVPPLMQLLPSSVSSHVTQYLPSNAGGSLWGGNHDVANALSPWVGFALLCGYAVVLVAAAAWRLRRVDV